MSDLRHFGKVTDVQLHRSGKKALVTFEYNDSALRAISSSGSLAGCVIRRAADKDIKKFKEVEDNRAPDSIQKLKQRFGVTGFIYRDGFGN